MEDILRGETFKTITKEMKGLKSSSINNIHDFLQDAQTFLEQTLSSEKLSRLALEHRSRLATKLSSLMKEYENHQMEMYIDMSPALKSFFHSSDASSSENGSEREQVPGSEEFYDVPNRDSVPDFDQPLAEDQCDAPLTTNSLPPAPETKKKGFMHRLLKSRSKASDLASTFSVAALKAQQTRSTSDEDSKSRRESEDSDILYDDALTVKPPKEEELFYDDASAIPKDSENVSNNMYTNEKVVKVPEEENLVYDDASRVVNDTSEEYEYVANQSISSVRELQNNNDSDGMSMKSGVSEYGANASIHRWHITASEAKAQSLRYGYMKRRNGRKLLSAWRHCYSVLLPTHLLMYANDGDNRPRIVIALTEPNIRVKRVVKQGVDTKRLKTHPFVLLHEDRALYEMSTKSREETEEWIMALQAILTQVNDPLESPTEKIDEDCYTDYDQPLECTKKTELQSRMESIQGRNLPSLPATELENNLLQQLNKTGKANGKMNTLFRFRGRSSSSEEEQQSKRQSVESIASEVDEVYQELPSPVASTTPYSSVENLKESTEDIYNSVEDVRNSTHDLPSNKNSAVSSVRGGNIQHSRSLSDGLVTWPNAPPEDLPVYDIPSPTIRPLSTIGVLSDEAGSNGPTGLKNQRQETKRGFISTQKSRNQSSSGSVNAVSEYRPEVYDVPVNNPRRISMAENENEALLAYDRVTTPPRTVIPHPEVKSPASQLAPTHATKKVARYWQEKVCQVDGPSNNFKKDTSPPTKCFPKPSSVEKGMPLAEIKSVGRCFSRISPQRAPLASLTELLASSKNGGDVQMIKPSAFKAKVANVNGSLTGIKETGGKQGKMSYSTFNPGVKASNIDNSNSNKREPPPRPPAPIRSPLTIKTSESTNLADELNRKLMKRVMKNEEVASGQLPTESKNMKDSTVTIISKPKKELYKARWAYVAINNLELSINSGEIVQVLTKSGASWLVQARNRKGLVPKEYLVPMAANALSLTKMGEVPITV